MQIRHDPDADAVKITLLDRPYAVSKVINDNCILDLDAEGNVIGIELLNVAKQGITANQIAYVDITRQATTNTP